tara:strand:- start:307 stop:594 length:288 start_codon:yes stop_codon:yes gene_type:complete
MKAQIRKSDNTVGRFWPDAKTLELTGEQLTVSESGVTEFIDLDATTENTTIVEGLDEPEDFQPHKYQYVDGALTVVIGWTDLVFGSENDRGVVNG